MKDQAKTKKELINELDELRQAYNILQESVNPGKDLVDVSVSLRLKAEDLLNNETGKAGSQFAETDVLKLVHELQVHQVELELQNEELIRLNEKLEGVNSKFTELYEFAPSGYFSLSKEGKILDLNLSGSKMFGIESSQLKNKSFNSFVSIASKPVFILFLTRVFASKTKESCEVTLSSAEGHPTTIHISGIVTANREECNLTVVDVTERRRDMEALQNSEERYKALFQENVSVMLLIHPQTGEIIDANPSACRFYGWSNEEICGMNISEINTLSTEEVKLEMQKSISDQHKQFFFKHRMANGEVRDVEVYSGPIKFGKTILLYSIVHDITERKRTEELLRQSSQMWEALTSASPDGIGMVALDGKMQMMSDNLAMMYGFSVDEKVNYIGSPAFDFIAPEFHETLAGNIGDLISGASKFKITEYLAVKKDKSRFYVEIYSTLLRDTAGNPANVMYLERDITQRKNAEDFLRKNEELLNAIVETAKDSIFIKNTSRQYIKVNKAMEVLFGMTKEEMLGKTDKDLFGNESSIHIGDVDRQVLDGNTVEEFPSKPVRGELRYFHTIKVPIKDAEGSITGLCGIARDITDGKLTEARLRVSEEKYRNIFNSMQDVYYEASLDGIILEISPSIETFSKGQLTREDLLGKSLIDFYVNPDDRISFFKEVNQKGIVRDYEVSMHNKEGSIVPISISSTILFGPDRKPLKISGTLRDITERKLAENALKQSANDLNYAQEIARMGSWDLDLQTGNTSWSKNFYRLIERDPLEFKPNQENFMKIVHPRDQHLIDDKLKEIMETKAPAILDIRLIMPDGRIKWVVNNIAPEFREGQLAALHGVNIDITIKKKAEEEINKLNAGLEEKIVERTAQLSVANENLNKEIKERITAAVALEEALSRLHKIADRIPGVVYQFRLRPDGSSCFPYASEGVRDIYGVSPEEVSEDASVIFKNLHPGDSEAVMASIQSSAAGMKIWRPEFRYRLSDGTIRWIQANAMPQSEPDGSVLWHGFISDISERKKAEEELQKVSTRLKLAARAGGVGVWDYDIVNNILEWDKQMYALYGIEEKDFSGVYEAWQGGLHPDDVSRGDEEIRMAIKGEKEFDTEFRVVWPDGTIRYIRAYAIVYRDKDGKASHMIGTNWDITDKKESEALLEQTRLNYETFFNTIDDFLFVLDEQGRIIHTNTTVMKRLGYSEKELSDQSVLMVHPPERREEAGRIVGEMLAGSADYCPVPLISKQGQYIPVETRVKTGLWDGKPVIFGVSKDISKIKLSEEKFSKAFQTNSALMAISDVNGRFLEVNTTFLKSTGYSRDEVLGKTSLELKLFKDGDLRYDLIEQLKQNIPIKDIELDVQKKDGSLRRGLFSAETIFIGADLSLLTMMVDITELKQIQASLQSSLAILEATKNSINDGILVIDKAKENILVMNKQFIEMFKVPMDITINNEAPALLQHLLSIVKQPDKFLEKLYFLYNHPIETARDEIELNNGIIVERYTAQVVGFNEEYQGRIWTWRDITQSKHAEEEIIKSRNEAVKANLAKSEFLSRMSHELRTPMNSILGFAQLMKMGELNAAHKKGVDHILKSGTHLLYLINEILDISRIEAGRLTLSLEPVQLNSIILEVLDIVQHNAAQRDLKTKVEDSSDIMLFVKADRQRLKQVLLNLINNGVKYNRIGGNLTISAELRKGAEHSFPALRISVSDNGPGIKPEDQVKLFLPFERIGAEKSETEGTGLGLMVAKKLMDVMGGVIGLDSTPGEGSTFWIELPQAESQKTVNARTRDALSIEMLTIDKAGTILYIEDNISNAELVEEILRDHRPAINIITSGFGKSGLQLATDLKPDLILLDLDLPDIHGSEVLEILQSETVTSNIPVVIISADAMPHQVEKLMLSGARDYLTKPLDIVGFLQMVDEWIQAKNK